MTTNLPIEEFSPEPAMVSMAFAITGAAVADTYPQLKKALTNLKAGLVEFQELFASVRKDLAPEAVLSDGDWTSPSVLRGAMEVRLKLEQSVGAILRALKGLLRNKDFRSKLTQPELPLSHRELADFTRKVQREWLPSLRQLRLEIILTIADRAQKQGLNVIDPSKAFRAMFLNASLEESEEWQETAFLLADVETAALLNQSIRSASHDRTDEFTALT